MTQLFLRFPIALLAIAVASRSAHAADATPTTAPVTLAPFEVNEKKTRGFYGLTAHTETGPNGVPRGARVGSVYDGGPAAVAGLKPRDLIMAIDGRGPGQWAFRGRVGQKRTLLVERTVGETKQLVTIEVTLRYFSFLGMLGAKLGFGAGDDLPPSPSTAPSRPPAPPCRCARRENPTSRRVRQTGYVTRALHFRTPRSGECANVTRAPDFEKYPGRFHCRAHFPRKFSPSSRRR